MKRFAGFPPKMRFTSIPNVFFSSILPQIHDLAELKVTLHIFWVLYQKKDYPKFVTYKELLGDQALMSSIKIDGSPPEELHRGLEAAVTRGTLLCLALQRDEECEELYFLNTESDRRAVAKIESGELELGGVGRSESAPTEERPNIFTLYEQRLVGRQ